MLSLGGGANKSSPPTKEPKDMKDKDGKSPKEKAKREAIAAKQPMKFKTDGAPIHQVLPWKPPTNRKLHKDTVHSALRESTRKWVSGEISTKQHNENMDRAKTALKGFNLGK